MRFLIFCDTALSKENDFVTINDELSWLKNYMYIQKIRFQDSFTIHYHIEPDMQSYKIPRFILQPFIENSLLHGFSEIHQGGIIILSIFTKDNSIFITIEDNGKGMSDLLIHSVLHGKNDGIGIGNTTNTYYKTAVWSVIWYRNYITHYGKYKSNHKIACSEVRKTYESCDYH